MDAERNWKDGVQRLDVTLLRRFRRPSAMWLYRCWIIKIRMFLLIYNGLLNKEAGILKVMSRVSTHNHFVTLLSLAHNEKGGAVGVSWHHHGRTSKQETEANEGSDI
jgi:hypothetical protein